MILVSYTTYLFYLDNFSYRYNPNAQKSHLQWYHPVDIEEDQRRWN